MQILTRRFLLYWYAKSDHAILGNFSSYVWKITELT